MTDPDDLPAAEGSTLCDGGAVPDDDTEASLGIAVIGCLFITAGVSIRYGPALALIVAGVLAICIAVGANGVDT